MTRAEIRAVAEHDLPPLVAGQSAWFDVPEGQPGRRVLYQEVQKAAHRIFSAGCYRMKTHETCVQVTRTAYHLVRALRDPAEATPDGSPKGGVISPSEIGDVG